MNILFRSLRKEKSINFSGRLIEDSIEHLKKKNYLILDTPLDGDAPKEFIKVYEYNKHSGIKRNNPSTWIPYIAKTGEKWYPHESVIEYMINRIGQELGMCMNEVALYKINGQIRFLSRYFLKKNESLTHGAEICGEYLDDIDFAKEIANHKPTSRKLFTFEFVTNAIKHKFKDESHSILQDLVKMIIFDALVGNNDRHFYNWGVITTLKKLSGKARLSPIYDSARGLLWNFNEFTINKYLKGRKSNGKQFDNYIYKACPRISIEGNSEINHFDLVRYLKKENTSNFKLIIDTLSSMEQEKRVLNMLKNEFYPMFSKDRCLLISQIIETRFKNIREI